MHEIFRVITKPKVYGLNPKFTELPARITPSKNNSQQDCPDSLRLPNYSQPTEFTDGLQALVLLERWEVWTGSCRAVP